jgi:hypothetical protein
VPTEITPETKVAELLEEYPDLEETLISLAPPFGKLRNPVLRRTIARVTSLRQAAKVGGISLQRLINELRSAAGLKSYDLDHSSDHDAAVAQTGRIDKSRITISYDARDDINKGIQPIRKVLNDLKSLGNGDVYELIAPFVPAPLIDKADAAGFISEVEQVSSGEVKTYFVRDNRAKRQESTS